MSTDFAEWNDNVLLYRNDGSKSAVCSVDNVFIFGFEVLSNAIEASFSAATTEATVLCNEVGKKENVLLCALIN